MMDGFQTWPGGTDLRKGHSQPWKDKGSQVQSTLKFCGTRPLCPYKPVTTVTKQLPRPPGILVIQTSRYHRPQCFQVKTG